MAKIEFVALDVSRSKAKEDDNRFQLFRKVRLKYLQKIVREFKGGCDCKIARTRVRVGETPQWAE